MSETLDIANTLIDTSEKGNSLFTVENEGQTCISSGKLLPYVQAKVIFVVKKYIIVKRQLIFSHFRSWTWRLKLRSDLTHEEKFASALHIS